jgi:antitoxin component YwqK of YwqJK toxin-antitoxin module
MRNFYLCVLLFQLICGVCYSQKVNINTTKVKLDTIYYDKDWKVVSNVAFASFFRVYDANDKSELRKPFRDYYITGELQSEGGYISIDKYNDFKFIFDGELINYYKNGQVEMKAYLNRGIFEGEYTLNYENGLICRHGTYKNGKLEGIMTEFSEQGDLCVQQEMLNDKPRYNYYVVSNKDGYCSKFRRTDNTPIFESPSLNEMKIEYLDGNSWLSYKKNGLLLVMNNTKIRDYGKWFQITIAVANNSIIPIEFDPDKITSTLQKKNGQIIALEVWSSDQYMKKVRRTQNWNMALAGLGEGLAAAGAGYSTSTTRSNTTYNGYSNTFGNAYAYGTGGSAFGSYSGHGSYHGNSSTTSRTTTYDGAAAYQARVIASNRMADFENSLLQERAIKQEGYLRKTTIYPGDVISGYVNIKREKGNSMTIYIDINGAIYEFPWNITE